MCYVTQKIKVRGFSTHESLDTFIRSNNKFPMKVTHNDPYPCTLCKDQSHQMIQMYLKCNCGDNNVECNLKYCVRACLNNCSDWLLWISGEHDIENDKQIKTKVTEYSLPILIERLFKEELELDQSISAKKLLNRITNARKKNMKKPEEERVEKYTFSKKLLPTLIRVSIYIIHTPQLIN